MDEFFSVYDEIPRRISLITFILSLSGLPRLTLFSLDMFSSCCFCSHSNGVKAKTPRGRSLSHRRSSSRDGYYAAMVQADRMEKVTIRKSLDDKIYLECISGTPPTVRMTDMGRLCVRRAETSLGLGMGVTDSPSRRRRQDEIVIHLPYNVSLFVHDSMYVIVDGALQAHRIICIGCAEVEYVDFTDFTDPGEESGSRNELDV